MSHVSCFIQGKVIYIQVLLEWLVFIHVVRGRSGGHFQFSKGKLLRSSWHLFHMALAQCGQRRNAMLGQ